MVPPMTSIIKGGFFLLWPNPAPVKMCQGMSLCALAPPCDSCGRPRSRVMAFSSPLHKPHQLLPSHLHLLTLRPQTLRLQILDSYKTTLQLFLANQHRISCPRVIGLLHL